MSRAASGARHWAYRRKRSAQRAAARANQQISQLHPYRRSTASLRPLPDFLVIGAQKCGTTALAGHLRRHPDVVAAREKELHYFDREPAPSIGRYRSHFPVALARRNAVTFEATPKYLFHPAAAERAATVLPRSTRMVVLLREPVERAVSQLEMGWREQWERLDDPVEALEAEDDRLRAVEERGMSAFDEEGPTWGLYRTRGMYADQLERWFAHFPRENFLILRTEDMRADTQAAFDSVCQFVGLAPHRLDGLRTSRSTTVVTPEVRSYLAPFFVEPNRRLADLVGVKWP